MTSFNLLSLPLESFSLFFFFLFKIKSHIPRCFNETNECCRESEKFRRFQKCIHILKKALNFIMSYFLLFINDGRWRSVTSPVCFTIFSFFFLFSQNDCTDIMDDFGIIFLLLLNPKVVGSVGSRVIQQDCRLEWATFWPHWAVKCAVAGAGRVLWWLTWKYKNSIKEYVETHALLSTENVQICIIKAKHYSMVGSLVPKTHTNTVGMMNYSYLTYFFLLVCLFPWFLYW